MLGARFVWCCAHGSAVTGDVLPGISHLDVKVLLHADLQPAKQAGFRPASATSTSDRKRYVQPSIFDAGRQPAPALVPASFVLITDDQPAQREVFTNETLRLAGQRWLAEMPSRIARDTESWATATGDGRGVTFACRSLASSRACALTSPRRPELPSTSGGRHGTNSSLSGSRWIAPHRKSLGQLLAALVRRAVDEVEAGTALLDILVRVHRQTLRALR